MSKNIFVILNAKAGAGINEKIIYEIKKCFSANHTQADLAFTGYAGHAMELSREAAKKYDIIVAAGGDGTVHEAALPLVNTNTALGVIPVGSGNGLARHLKIPLNIKKAIEVICCGKIQRLDTLLINNKFCINIGGTGFDAHIAFLFSKHGRRGLISYIYLVMREYFSYNQKNYMIDTDGYKINRKAFLISIANASQFGNNTHIAPAANMQDGMMDITILKKIPLIKIPGVALKIFNGSLANSKYAELIRCKTLALTCEKEMALHLDGEPDESYNEIKASVLPLSIQMIIP